MGYRVEILQDHLGFGKQIMQRTTIMGDYGLGYRLH